MYKHLYFVNISKNIQYIGYILLFTCIIYIYMYVSMLMQALGDYSMIMSMNFSIRLDSNLLASLFLCLLYPDTSHNRDYMTDGRLFCLESMHFPICKGSCHT